MIVTPRTPMTKRGKGKGRKIRIVKHPQGPPRGVITKPPKTNRSVLDIIEVFASLHPMAKDARGVSMFAGSASNLSHIQVASIDRRPGAWNILFLRTLPKKRTKPPTNYKSRWRFQKTQFHKLRPLMSVIRRLNVQELIRAFLNPPV